MNTPTLCLDLLILLASVFPSGFSYSVEYIFRKKREETTDITSLIFILFPFLIIFIVIIILRKNLFFLTFPPNIFYVIALAFAPICLFLEYILNVLFVYLATGKISKGITVHSAWKIELSIPIIVLIIIIAVGEELIYRQLWFTILDRTFHLPIIFIILITSLIYGLNHLYFGFRTVLSKTISGIIYGLLYFFSGYSILVPLITHVLQNIILILITKGKNG